MNEKLEISPKPSALLKFALPTIIGQVFSNIYSIIDGLFVTNLIGTDALSAVNIVMPFLMIITALGFMVGTGGSAYISRQIGEGKQREARENFSMLMIFCVGICAVFSVAGIVFRTPVLRLLGADELLYPLCEQYAVPLFAIIPFAAFSILFQMFFVTEGRPSLGMSVSVLGGVTNIFLDYLFLKHFKMGISGAALATGIGYAIPSVIGLWYFVIRRRGSLYFVKPRFRIRVLFQMAGNGASEMVNMISGSISTIVINNIVMGLAGSDGVAAVTIIFYVQALLSSIFTGYSAGVAPLTAYRFGQSDDEKLAQMHRINKRLIILSALTATILCYALAEPLISIFSNNNIEVAGMAVTGMYIFAPGLVFMGINMYASSFFTALSDGKTSAILSFFRTLVFTVVLLLILPPILRLTGMWIALPLAEILSTFMTIYYFKAKKGVYHYG
ncbi:MAG: MATE family efflux transporter [Bacteroides sp.]|nr:MATE family efflux transporter [Eubacterium sp.]MCM1418779.1 MATE family efflux transporter [Roseburia sp.]MCM1462436.1 MATE family efflux transporter [Bacteroides sp.]